MLFMDLLWLLLSYNRSKADTESKADTKSKADNGSKADTKSKADNGSKADNESKAGELEQKGWFIVVLFHVNVGLYRFASILANLPGSHSPICAV
uniref:Uncharacterized protein n=1 Tax=Chenopodium quinoa TaxID=63459 RepID=A0A803LTU1_CHEQI